MTTNGSNGNGASGGATAASAPLVLVGAQSGVTLIPSPTPLTRLNYFDGKFLRADDLSREQDYLRRLVELSNQAGGSGVVSGFDLLRGSGTTLTLTAGLAIDPRGRVLFLPHEGTLDLLQLIERSRQSSSTSSPSSTSPATGGAAPGFAECETAAAAGEAVAGTLASDLYLVTIAPAEALCGEEDVYGKLCEDACVGSTQRPWRLEGVVVRAVPLTLPPAPCTASWLTPRHRRSQVASAWFAGERALLGHDLSAQRLRGEVWCRGAVAETGDALPIAVVSATGGTIHFIDPWIVRRERFAPVPPRWWQWQTQMRPLAVFWAQILQFQCQLADGLGDGVDTGGGNDPCAGQTALLEQVKALLAQVQQSGQALPPGVLTALGGMGEKVGNALTGSFSQSSHVLVDLGITELPSAGYLPVDPASALDVNEQVKRWMGEGVDLRFCVVRPDYVAHALEEAQHLDRICLLSGMDDPSRLQAVDVLVPDGELLQAPAQGGGLPMEVRVRLAFPEQDVQAPTNVEPRSTLVLTGAGRAEVLPGGGGAFHFAGKGFLFEAPRPRQDGNTAVGVPVKNQNSLTGAQPTSSIPVAGNQSSLTGAQPTTSNAARVLQALRRSSANLATATTDTSIASASTAATDTSTASASASDTTTGAFSTSTSNATAGAAKDTAAGSTSTTDTASGSSLKSGGGTSGGAAARRGAKKRSGGEQGGGVWAFQTSTAPAPRQVVVQERVEGIPPSAWASVRIERNPFTLQVFEAVGVSGEFVLSTHVRGDETTPDRDEVVVIVLQGDLEVSAASGGSSLEGTARGSVFVRGTEGSVETETVQAGIRLTLQGTAAQGQVKIEVSVEDDLRMALTTAWSGDPVLATADLRTDWIETYRLALVEEGDPAAQAKANALESQHPEYRALPVGLATGRENAQSAVAGNAAHDAAVQALTTLETLLEEPGFRAAREALLFPPPAPAPTGQSRVRATRDWVLFHRRRATSCCDCVPAQPVSPAAGPPRHYRLYHVLAAAGTSIAQIRAAIGGTAPVPGTVEVPLVLEFLGNGSFNLNTPNTQVAAAWTPLTKGASIVYGAVAGANAGTADPAAVHDGRLEHLASVLDDTTPDDNAVYEVLSTAPPSFSAAGADGVMVLVTQDAPVQSTCLRTVAFRDQGMMTFFLRELQSGRGAALLSSQFGLGSVSYGGGSAVPQAGSLQPVVNAWRSHYPTEPAARAVLVLPTATAEAGDALAGQQAQAVLTALSGQLTEGIRRSAESLAGDCGGVLVIEPGQRVIVPNECQTVLFVSTPDPAFFDQQVASMQASGTADLDQGSAAPQFQPGTATLAALGQIDNNQVVRAATILPPGATAAQQLLATQRTSAIMTAIGRGSVPQRTVVARVAIPVGTCQAITLVQRNISIIL